MGVLTDPLCCAILTIVKKDPIVISISASFLVACLLVGAIFAGLVQHPGHCGASPPDYERLFSEIEEGADAGSL